MCLCLSGPWHLWRVLRSGFMDDLGLSNVFSWLDCGSQGLGTELFPLPNSYVETRNPNVTVLGDRAFKGVLRLDEVLSVGSWSNTRVHDISSSYCWCFFLCHWVKGCLKGLTVRLLCFRLQLIRILGQVLLEYINTLLFLKLLTTNFSSHLWIIFPTGLVTVES